MSQIREEVAKWAGFIKGLGFRVWIAESGTYGFISDASESRVLSFGFSDGGSLGGNYGPPSRESGTGWRMDGDPWSLKTAADVRRALYAEAPDWTRRNTSGGRCQSCGQPRHDLSGRSEGWMHYTTVAQHLAQYGSSSKYREI
jgi:hypothetical protein